METEKEFDRTFEERVKTTIKKSTSICFNVKLAKILGNNAAIYLSALMWKRDWFINHNKITPQQAFFNTQQDMEETTLLNSYKQTKALKILESFNVVSVKKMGMQAKNFFTINYEKIDFLLSIPEEYFNNESVKNLMSSGTKNKQLLIKKVTDYINIINKNTINENIINNFLRDFQSLKKLSSFDGAKLLQKGSLKKRSKILLQNTPLQNTPLLRERFSKETLSPKIPIKKAKEVFISKDVKSIIDYWTENKLRMPSKETKSYRNCVIKTRDLLLGKLFLKDKRYSIEEIKSSIDNFTQAVYNPDIEPIAPDKKKKLKSLSIGDFIFSFQGYSYFKEYLNKKPSKVIEDKFPSMTKALKRLYSEDVFGTTHKAFDFEEENHFRRASIRLKKFLNDNNKNWSNMMIPVGDYEEARLLWESIKSSLNGADDFSKVTPSWLISNHTFNHRLPAFLYHQGYLLEDIEIRKEKTRTFSDRDIMRMQDQEERRSEIEYTRYLLGY